MKTPSLIAFLVVIVLGAQVFAQSDNDAASNKNGDATEARVEKEAEVKKAEAKFNEKQKLFDEAAEELQEARNEYVKELSELTKPMLNEMIDLSEQFSERLSLFAPNASRFVLNTEALQRELEYLSDGVVGVYLSQQNTPGVGVGITRTIEGAPAAIAGLESGDVIIEIDGVDITEEESPYAATSSMINEKGSGATIRFKIRRDQEYIDFEVETIDRLALNAIESQSQSLVSNTNPITYSYAGSPWAGASTFAPLVHQAIRIPQRTNNYIFVMEIEEDLGQYFGVEYGVLVLKADDVEGLQAGDILLEIDEQPIRSLSHALRYKRDADDDEIEILFKRNKRDRNITLEKDQFELNAILQ